MVLSLLVFVGAVEDGAEAAAIQRCTVNHVGILLVITRVGHNRNHDVLACRKALCPIEFTHVGRHHRDFRVAQDMAHGIKAFAKVEGVDPHGLLTHRALVRISRRLIVIREGDIGRRRSQDDTRMNFTVRCGEICDRLVVIHGNIGAIRFTRINVFEQVPTLWRFPQKQLVPVGDRLNLGSKLTCFVCRNLSQSRGVVDRANDTARLCADPQFLECVFPDNSCIQVQDARTLCLSQAIHHICRVLVEKQTDP